MQTYQHEHTFTGHTAWVYSLVAHKNVLFSGAGEGTIRVWDLSSKENINNITTQTGWISCMAIENEKLFAGLSYGEKDVRVIDVNTYEHLHAIKGHSNSITAIATVDQRMYIQHVYTGSRDRTIRAWEIDGWQSRGILEGHNDMISCIIVGKGCCFRVRIRPFMSAHYENLCSLIGEKLYRKL